ncbi:hypothetical protein GGC47_003982 [Bosea sp. OAE752]
MRARLSRTYGGSARPCPVRSDVAAPRDSIEDHDQRLALARLQRLAPELENGGDGRIGAGVRDRSVLCSPAWTKRWRNQRQPTPDSVSPRRNHLAGFSPRFGSATATIGQPKCPDFKHLRRSTQPASARPFGRTRIYASSTMNSGDFRDCASCGAVAILPRGGDSSRHFQGLASALKLIPTTHTFIPDVVSTRIDPHYSLTRGVRRD